MTRLPSIGAALAARCGWPARHAGILAVLLLALMLPWRAASGDVPEPLRQAMLHALELQELGLVRDFHAAVLADALQSVYGQAAMQEVRSLTEQHRQRAERWQQAVEQLASRRRQLVQAHQALRPVQAERAALARELAGLRGLAGELDAAIEQAQQRRGAARQAVGRLLQELEALDAAVTEASAAARELGQQIGPGEHVLQKQATALRDGFNARLQSSQQRLERARAQDTERVQAFERWQAARQQELQAAQARIDAAAARYEQLRAAALTARAAVGEAISAYNERLEAAQSSLAPGAALSAAAQDDLRELREQARALRLELEAALGALDTARAAFETERQQGHALAEQLRAEQRARREALDRELLADRQARAADGEALAARRQQVAAEIAGLQARLQALMVAARQRLKDSEAALQARFGAQARLVHGLAVEWLGGGTHADLAQFDAGDAAPGARALARAAHDGSAARSELARLESRQEALGARLTALAADRERLDAVREQQALALRDAVHAHARSRREVVQTALDDDHEARRAMSELAARIEPLRGLWRTASARLQLAELEFAELRWLLLGEPRPQSRSAHVREQLDAQRASLAPLAMAPEWQADALPQRLRAAADEAGPLDTATAGEADARALQRWFRSLQETRPDWLMVASGRGAEAAVAGLHAVHAGLLWLALDGAALVEQSGRHLLIDLGEARLLAAPDGSLSLDSGG